MIYKVPIVIVSMVITSLLIGLSYRQMMKSRNPSAKQLSDTVLVEMKDDEYVPSLLKIKKGTRVRFINKSSAVRWPASDLHPSHELYSDFDPQEPVVLGESWDFVFLRTGEWSMHDHLAPYITGKITVSE